MISHSCIKTNIIYIFFWNSNGHIHRYWSKSFVFWFEFFFSDSMDNKSPSAWQQIYDVTTWCNNASFYLSIYASPSLNVMISLLDTLDNVSTVCLCIRSTPIFSISMASLALVRCTICHCSYFTMASSLRLLSALLLCGTIHDKSDHLVVNMIFC